MWYLSLKTKDDKCIQCLEVLNIGGEVHWLSTLLCTRAAQKSLNHKVELDLNVLTAEDQDGDFWDILVTLSSSSRFVQVYGIGM